MGSRPNERDSPLASLDASFSRDAVSMDLTMCGLLVDKAEEMGRLYAAHRDWTEVEDRWFEERVDGRSTKGSSRKVYRVLSSRFKTADKSLPPISRLPSVFDECESERDKAQVLYFYLVEDDPLVKYVVHEYVDRLQNRETEALDFGQDVIETVLGAFHYADGEPFDYADSTVARWGEGFRSVMREIGVLETQQTLQGQPPNLGTVPLLVASGYSWEVGGKDWISAPIGWFYLFQPAQYWDTLAKRLGEHPNWEASGIHGELRLEPTDEPFGWVDPVEGEE